jgi:hypothetical protein
MDVRIDVRGLDGVQRMLATFPGKAHRACAVALNQTGKAIKQAEQGEMRRVFDKPVPYTLNSLQLTPAKPNDLVARVWFREPDRMGQHYLVPQVEGGPRKLKGFERGIDDKELVPGAGVKRTAAGNVSTTVIRAALKGVRQKADYFYLKQKHGKLLPGVYQRVKTSRGVRASNRKAAGYTVQGGRKRGRFVSAIMARGLKPLFIVGRTGRAVKPELDFYGVANRIYATTFANRFYANLNQYLKS